MSAGKHIAGWLVLALVGAPGAAEAEGGSVGFTPVEVSAELCARLATYVPNGEADYKPGVAADGRAVAPADIDVPVETRELYSFPVKIAPFGNGGKYAADSTLEVATVTFDPKTGIVLVDGQQVTGADRALADACAHRLEKSGD
ncbi:hypothetical protein [Parvibaculum sp.]|uniref:hypothetical protein n=1 Tax=Parvibaculum sp. TaxID=2024848 RepID=UPI00320C45A1